MKALLNRPALIASLSLIGFFWFLLFNRIHTEWVVNELYSYGWAVPFLALFLVSERWRDRPAPAASAPHPALLIAPLALLLIFAPIRIVNEANPDWVKINFYFTATVAAFSFYALFALGRIRYMWHFAFPIFFTFTALPWPVWIEENLVQTLTRWNTLTSAECLTLSGTPAMATGNLIQIGSTWVNVAEACSGIRSLQTSFMMSLFLGEFYRLGPILRVLLMGSSFVVAFALNVGRTMTLTYLAGEYGNAKSEEWHDTVGNIVMVLCLVGLWLLALGAEKIRNKFFPRPVHVAPEYPPVANPFPVAFVATGFALLIAAEAATEYWYRKHEALLPPTPEWVVQWPESSKDFKFGEMPDRTRAILKYNEASTASWETSEGTGWQMYHIRWYPGRVSKFLSGAHYPTVCLPATGLKLRAETGRWVCRLPDLSINFATFIFDSGNRPVYVFHAIIEDQPSEDGERIDYRQVTTEERIASVKKGHRNLGQRVVGISIMGAGSFEEAEASVQSTLSQMIKNPAPTTAKN